MTTARDLMTPEAEFIHEGSTVEHAALKLRELDVGAIPICGESARLIGMITDRDIAIHCVAGGHNPAEADVASLGLSAPVTIGADDSIDEAIETMKTHHLRRLPVIDDHQLVGILTQTDIAHHEPYRYAGDLLETLSKRSHPI